MTNSTMYRGFEIISNSDSGSWNIQSYHNGDDGLRVVGHGSTATIDAARALIDKLISAGKPGGATPEGVTNE